MTAGERPVGGRDRLRVVVVGAGVTGLLAAIRCVQDGHRVVLLERGRIPHPESTSYDQHRALRALAVGDPAATGRSARLHRLWLDLDRLLGDRHRPGARLYRQTGVLTALAPGTAAAALATAAAAGLPLRAVDPADHPRIGLPAGATAVLEPHAGVLLADRVLHAAARWLRRHRLAEPRPATEVVGVRPGSGRVLLADGSTETGDAVLITAGPWTAALTGQPVTLHRQTMVYLRPPAELAAGWAAAPVAGGIGADGRAWLIPSVAGTLLKISTDAARREVTTLTDPGDPAHWTDRILSGGIVADLDRYTLTQVRHCHYATAADTGFVRIGPAVWARPASGGDGFRTAPQAVADLAAELADTATPTDDIPAHR